MSFLKDVISEFTHHGNKNQQNSSQGPPPVSPPWIAEWDSRDERCLFVNQQTGERTFNYPGPGYQNQGGYNQGYGGQGGYNQGGYQQSGYGGPPYQTQGGQYQEQGSKQSGGGNALKYGALGAVAGVAGGALLMHEGEEMKQDWDNDKYAMENRVDNFENDVADAPENAAYWAGNKVQEVEDIPQDIENKWDNAVQDVEDVPEDVAGWAGEKVGGVERFGDEMGDAYDDGRDDARYDDDNGGDDGGW